MTRGRFETDDEVTEGFVTIGGFDVVEVTSVWGVMIGCWGIEGMNGGAGWYYEIWGNDNEAKDVEAESESSGIQSVVIDDWGEFWRVRLLINLAFSISSSLMNSGFATISSNSLFDVVLNKDRPKYSSKGRSSRNNHFTGHEWDRKIGVGLNKLSYLRILGMRLGFSNMGGGLGSGLDLVYLLEASVFRNS